MELELILFLVLMVAGGHVNTGAGELDFYGENESSNCQEVETRRYNLTRWNRLEKRLSSESSDEEISQWCNQSEFSLHCSQEDECRSPGICQHISCHYPHVAEFRSIPAYPL